MQGWIVIAFWPLIFVMVCILICAAAEILTDHKYFVRKKRIVKVIRLKRTRWPAKQSFIKCYKSSLIKKEPSIDELVNFVDKEI